MTAPSSPDSPDGERSVPFYCPYCGDEDLRPHDATPGTWACRACTRVFSVKLLGMVHRGAAD